MASVNLAVRTARLVYSCVFSTIVPGGTCSTAGAKFQMAPMPPATIVSATCWAASAGTVRMPMWTCIRLARSPSFSIGRTSLPWTVLPTLDASRSKAATMFKLHSLNPS
jgi:hypothetical protein